MVIIVITCLFPRLQIYTPDQLNELMSVSDYVVAALPHTDATEKLINAEAINRMKKTGVFINIGRGGTVDEPALVKGLLDWDAGHMFACAVAHVLV